MNADERKKLMRQMGEAAALAPDDPQRQEIERQVQDLEIWAEEYWQNLLNENELLRAELRRVEISSDLEYKLLGIHESSRRRNRRRLVLAIAAVLLIGVGFLLWPRIAFEYQLRTIAALAVEDHMRMKDKDLKVTTQDLGVLERELNKQLPFKAYIPHWMCPKEGRLKGGQKCILNGHTVAYFLSYDEKARNSRSLFQFRLKDFDLPKDLAMRRVYTGRSATVSIWTNDEFGFLSVADPYYVSAD